MEDRKVVVMKFEELYLCCCNLIGDSNMTVLEEGKEPIRAELKDIYDTLLGRQVIWFSVENGYTILIKLKEE